MTFVSACHHRGVSYVLSPGESLPEVAHTYGVDLVEIVSVNQITDPVLVKPGQRIWIPGGNPAAWAKSEQVLTKITDGDSAEEPGPTKSLPVKKASQKAPSAPHASSKDAAKVSRTNVSEQFIWPVEGKIVSPFGMRKNKMHNGVDIRVTPESPVRAVSEGMVVYRGRGIEGYGDLIIVKHRDRLFSVYAYVGEILPEKGVQVQKGEVIARASHNRAYAFVHFELRQAKRALDPLKWLPRL